VSGIRKPATIANYITKYIVKSIADAAQDLPWKKYYTKSRNIVFFSHRHNTTGEHKWFAIVAGLSNYKTPFGLIPVSTSPHINDLIAAIADVLDIQERIVSDGSGELSPPARHLCQSMSLFPELSTSSAHDASVDDLTNVFGE